MTGAATGCRDTLTQAAIPDAWAASKCPRKLGGGLDRGAVGVEGAGHLLIAAGAEVAADRAVGTVGAVLDLHLGVPASVVADHGDERQAVPEGGVDLQRVEAEGTVAQGRGDARLREPACARASANGRADPIAPAGPLMMRCGALTQACAHCPISPPSEMNTDSAAPARKSCTA